jgi:type II secretory pathway pseudopilin PulG
MRHGFSLIEVVLALGIVSFALMTVLALLPLGLRSIKNANEMAGASAISNDIADRLRAATTTDGINFESEYQSESIRFSVGGNSSEVKWTDLTLNGYRETANSPKRLSAVVSVFPPGQPTAPGRAIVSVAWSAQANPVWNTAAGAWDGAEGNVVIPMQFLLQR